MTEIRKGKWRKLGCIFTPNNIHSSWVSNAMAPTAIEWEKGIIRVYVGGWDGKGISRINYIDVSAHNPLKILEVSKAPVLDIGEDGTFDENGVFPSQAAIVNQKVYLYYVGFQLGYKVRHYNFGGLATSEDGKNFSRVSKSPILDRADEGLIVRAGQSIYVENGIFHTCYSAGSGWEEVAGALRPMYDVYYQRSDNGIDYAKEGRCIVPQNNTIEHALGRPQLLKLQDTYLVCFSRRTRDMHYNIGCAVSKDLEHWQRLDKWLELPHGNAGEFDSDMVYYPSIVQTHSGKVYLFYCGNGVGKGGLGVAELIW